MGYCLSKDMRKISKKGIDRSWFKFKRIYLLIEERARSGESYLSINDLDVQEIDFLTEEKFKVSTVKRGTNTIYLVEW